MNITVNLSDRLVQRHIPRSPHVLSKSMSFPNWHKHLWFFLDSAAYSHSSVVSQVMVFVWLKSLNKAAHYNTRRPSAGNPVNWLSCLHVTSRGGWYITTRWHDVKLTWQFLPLFPTCHELEITRDVQRTFLNPRILQLILLFVFKLGWSAFWV